MSGEPVLVAGASELEALRGSVRAVCREYGHDYYLRTSAESGNARELWAALAELGAVGVAIPERYGGGGQGMAALAVVAEETAAAGCPIPLLALSPAVCATMLSEYGSSEQRAEWLPGLADGSRTLAFAITEPDAGSNTYHIATRATYRDGAWVLSGQKTFVSHVDNADALLVVAQTEGGPDSLPPGLRTFVVPTDARGLERSPIPIEIVSPERQYALFFDDVQVPADAIVGAEHGMSVLFAGLNPERIISAALLNGIARYALDKAVAYAKTRAVWGEPIGAHQAVAHPLARAETRWHAARTMTREALASHDAGQPVGVLAAMAKLEASEVASAALDAAIQTHGGNGMAREYGLATLSGVVRLFRIAPVTTEMALNHIAHKALGLPRSYG